ncbi:MAG: fibronectin type III domain-containing protein [Eggerthellaceae bacterium]|nr:fibronectin type III domain-containing protein [Eggerthellaceae bacterium]
MWQTNAGLNQVTVKWGVPANAKRDGVDMQHWRVSWRKLGDEKWSGPETMAYSSSPYAAREYTIKGLEQGTTYEVRVGYRYQVGGDGGSYVTVEDWRSCTATTGMTLTFGESSFDYHFTSHNESRAALEASVAGPKAFDNYTTQFWYEWYVTPGAKLNATAANEWYKDSVRSYVQQMGNQLSTNYGAKDHGYANTGAGSYDGLGLRNGNAVATVGVRTVFRSTSRDSKYNLIETVAKSGWSTKHVVADPQFRIGKDIVSNYKVTGFTVEIPPLKGAQSYTIYLGKRKSANSSKVTGWKAAGTFAAKSGKTTKAVVSKYGGKKAKFSLRGKWAVKVVTNTKYGSSPGDFWRGYWLKSRITKDLACLDKVAKYHLSWTQRLRFYFQYTGRTTLNAADKERVRHIVRFCEGRE